jgi:hypothetical protein
MKTFSISMMSLVAMTGLAFAQAGAKVDAKAGAGAGAGSAAAGAKVDAKAGAGAQTGAAAQAGAAAAPAKPTPPAEIKAAIKAMGKATKTCTGQGMGPDMQMADFKGTVTMKADLDGWFVRTLININIGKGKTASKMKMEQLSTYDAKLAKWRVVGVSNDGATMMGTAEMKDGKYEFAGDMTGGMGTAMFKDHGDMTDPKAAKWWGEMSMDKGKTWTKVYEQTCK